MLICFGIEYLEQKQLIYANNMKAKALEPESYNSHYKVLNFIRNISVCISPFI